MTYAKANALETIVARKCEKRSAKQMDSDTTKTRYSLKIHVGDSRAC